MIQPAWQELCCIFGKRRNTMCQWIDIYGVDLAQQKHGKKIIWRSDWTLLIILLIQKQNVVLYAVIKLNNTYDIKKILNKERSL